MAGKKRKASGQSAKSHTQDFDKSKGRVAFTTYEDIADSEDEFHINRDKVMLDEEPHAKRQRKSRDDDELIEQSDEEILGYSEESSDDEEVETPKSKKKSKAQQSDDEDAEEEDEYAEGWGSSKRDYYDADHIETEADALEEEAEAKRLQQKKLSKMTEADFGLDDFDGVEWLGDGDDNEEGDVVTEILKDVEITDDMSPEEKLRILSTRYPEFEFLADEFLQLKPVLEELEKEVEKLGEYTIDPTPISVMKARALAAYMATISMYFALLTSPAQKGVAKTMDPAELRDHEIMDYLKECRELWSKVKSIEAPQVEDSSNDESMEDLEDTIMSEEEMETIPSTKKSRKELARAAAAERTAAKRSKQIQEAEDELADLDNLVSRSKKSRKASRAVVEADDDSDFGEEESMDAKAAEEKAKRKKSLKFYTSQIAQKANRRADAGRGAGGDEDLPYRERLRDRQARLNLEAEKRGKKLDEYGRGAALGGESDDDDQAAVADEVRDDEDEYYNMVAQTSKKRKDDKETKYAAITEAKKAGKLARVVEVENDEDGKRAIGYVIEKNKGLAPKRKKEVRNPRVKKRMKYDEKKKKLGSMRAVYKGGEEKGGYGGEKTGIKTGLVKSRKL